GFNSLGIFFLGICACTAYLWASGAPLITNSFQPGASDINRLFVCLNIDRLFLVDRIPSRTIVSFDREVPIYCQTSPVVLFSILRLVDSPLYVIFKKLFILRGSNSLPALYTLNFVACIFS